MKKVIPIVAFSWLLVGCTTIATYKPHSPAGAPKPNDYPICLYNEDVEIPRPCALIGEITIDHTPFTLIGGSIDDEMKRVMKAAHEKGADVVQITSVQKPGFTSTDYGVTANLFRYTDDWERYPRSRDDFVAYVRQHLRSLDPIEGIWTDGLPNRIGIIRDRSKPGREFIAFTLNTESPAWPTGYKRMDIAHGNQPGVYQVVYYHNDFTKSDVIVTLDHGRTFSFILNSGDETYPVTFTKLGPSIPAHQNDRP
ncbi:MAG: hypothetical protein ABSE48_04015 [Verrucomicrobiota bacterium]